MENKIFSKKKFTKNLHDARFYILGLITIFVILIAVTVVSISGLIFGTIASVIIAIGYGSFVYSLFVSFETDHNMAQLAYGDTLLDITFKPGNFIILLPGYRIAEYKSTKSASSSGLLLDRNEMASTIEKKECQFKGDTKEMIDATGIRTNYYIDINFVYRFLMLAPSDFEASLMGNSAGDFALAFQNRICNLQQAGTFKDFQYFSKAEIDKRDSGIDMKREIPKYVIHEGFWVVLDGKKDSYEKPEWCNTIEDLSKDLYLPEFQTTIDLAKRYGLLLRNITIDDYVDPDKTEDARNDIRRQDFRNEKRVKEAEGKWESIKAMLDMIDDIPEEQMTKAQKLEWATNQVNMQSKDRKEIATSGNILVNESNKN